MPNSPCRTHQPRRTRAAEYGKASIGHMLVQALEVVFLVGLLLYMVGSLSNGSILGRLLVLCKIHLWLI